MSARFLHLCILAILVHANPGYGQEPKELISCWAQPSVSGSLDLSIRMCEKTGDPKQPYRFYTQEKKARETLAILLKEANKTDADYYRQLARLYSQLNEKTKAGKAFKQAAILYRQRMKKDSDNAEISRKLADCIKLEEPEEALRQLKQASRLSPKHVQVWLDLGQLQVMVSVTKLLNISLGSSLVFTHEIDPVSRKIHSCVSLKKGNGPDLEKIHQFAKGMKLADRYFSKAVELAPNNAMVYVKRGSYYKISADIFMALTRVQEFDSLYESHAWGGFMFMGLTELDFGKATELDASHTHVLVSAVSWVRLQMSSFLEQHKRTRNYEMSPELFAWAKKLKKIHDKTVEDVLKYSESTDPRKANPSRSLYFMQAFFRGQWDKACEYADRILQTDPGAETVWKCLALCLVHKANKDGMTLLKRTFPNPAKAHHHILYGYALGRIKDKGMIEHLERAYQMNPQDYLCMVSKAFLLVLNPNRNSKDLAEARKLLLKAKKCDDPLRESNEELLEMNLALLDALEGHTLKAQAKLLRVSQAHPELMNARQALDLLSGSLIKKERPTGKEPQEIPGRTPRPFSDVSPVPAPVVPIPFDSKRN